MKTQPEPCLHRFLHGIAPYKADVIYHYTSVRTMSCFIRETGDFLCSNYKCLKDETEYNFGLDKCWTYMAKQGYIKNEPKFRDFSTRVAQNVNPWTMSFSSARDSKQLWDEYALNGVSIGLKLPDIDEAISAVAQKVREGVQPSMLVLAPCFYTNQDILNVLDYSFSTYIPFLAQQRIHRAVDKSYICKCFVNKALYSKFQAEKETQVLSCVFSVISVLSTLFKDESKYQHEQEYRLVLAPPPGREPTYTALINNTKLMACSGLGPHLRSKGISLFSLFNEIITSPMDDDLKILNETRSQIDKLSLHIPVSKSVCNISTVS